MSYRILFSNIGYARGIDGSLKQHVERFGRHFYCSVPVQRQVLTQVKAIMEAEKPDLCCFVEIERGGPSDRFVQIEALADDDFHFYDIAGKYGAQSWLNHAPLLKDKGNGFLARARLPFERLYFAHGTKRLIYKLDVPPGISVFFSHFSLSEKVRKKQFAELLRLIKETRGDIMVLADFNIMNGFDELGPLLRDGDLRLLNREDDYTFRFHRRHLALDLCLCSSALADRTQLRIVPQPFSDHAALLVEIAGAA